jgi:Tol biopolymer transport system component
MTLQSGTTLGPYTVLAPLGAGGMGEVYRALDTRLGREVAVKVLRPTLAASEEARLRFEREARTISQISHVHICALYDVGHEGEVAYLVMELLEGETLADRLARGALAPDQVLRLGIEICSALDAAHRKGVVHRDLKPGNVMLTKSGVKLLDFGLAKALAREEAASPLTGLLTEAPSPSTEAGTTLGTLPYMAPEQLEGKPADARTDIFALGSVLYEMATGRRAFSGTSRASQISAILTSEPAPVSSVQPTSPPELDRLVKTCLAKDPADRWQSAHDIALQLRSAAETAPSRPAAIVARRRKESLPWLVAAAAVAVATAVFLRTPARRADVAMPIRFSVAPPADGAFRHWVEGTSMAVSPDGSHLAYVAIDAQGKRIFLRPLSAGDARALPGTEDASSLFFSPDGGSIAFFAKGKLSRLELAGGTAVPICDIPPGGGASGTWGRDGEIVFGGYYRDALYRVPVAGGAPVAAIRLDTARGQTQIQFPSFLPDGKSFLYALRTRGGNGSLMLAVPGKAPRALLPIASVAQYAEPGVIVFARDGALLGQHFDWRSGRLSGGPFSIAEHVRYFQSTGSAEFALSANGATLVYQPREDVRRLVWYDRSGGELGTVGPPGNYLNLRIAPDARRVLVDRTRAGSANYDIWSLDLPRGAETRITSDPLTECYPVWLPGKSIAYSAEQFPGRTAGDAPRLVRRDLATGKEEELVHGGIRFQIAGDVSPDGRSLAYTERTEGGTWDAWILPLSGGTGPTRIVPSSFNVISVRFSPDGRFVVFLGDESGRPEVYVVPYPGPGEKTRVSTGGARDVRWSRDGREIFYVSTDRRLMSAPVKTTPTLEIGEPTALFTLAGKTPWPSFDVAPDGRSFLAIVPVAVADEQPLEVVVNGIAGFAR